MYLFTETDFGIKVIVEGGLDCSEVGKLKAEFVLLLAKQSGSFSLLVDARTMIPTESSSLAIIQECEELAIKAGLERMAIMVKSPVVGGQVRQIAHLSGTASIAKYIDATHAENCEKLARDWVTDGIEPAENTALDPAGKPQTNV